MVGNEDVTTKNLRKKRLHLSQHDLEKLAVNFIVGIIELGKKNSYSIHNSQGSLNHEKSNFWNPLITATEENMKLLIVMF